MRLLLRGSPPSSMRPRLAFRGLICNVSGMTGTLTAADLLASPALYPQRLDAIREALFLVRLDRAAYAHASFLDDRILEGAQAIGWVPFAPVAGVAPHVRRRPLHVIFHAGHVGSTLLSRLLDEVPGVLGLREPLPLRSLAEMHDHPSGLGFAPALETLLALWARGFDDTHTVILKATSSAGRIAPEVMAAAPQARAVYLNLPAETYIATLLSGDNTVRDLEGHTHERLARLKRLLGVMIDASGPLSIGEGAAVAWLAERFAQSRAAALLGPRLLELDFETMLDNVEATLARVLPHFGLPAGEAARLAASPVMTRYAKQTDASYSQQLRRDLLAQTRREQGEEIARGMALLEQLAGSFPAVAALTGRA